VKDRVLIEQTLKREIAGRLWGDEGKYVVDIINDIEKAERPNNGSINFPMKISTLVFKQQTIQIMKLKQNQWKSL